MAAYTAADLAAYLQQDVDTATAMLVLKVAADAAKAYTRGQGFTGGVPGDDVAAVVLMAAARMYANPESYRSVNLGSLSYTLTPFSGWTLAELAILHTHRRRAA